MTFEMRDPGSNTSDDDDLQHRVCALIARVGPERARTILKVRREPLERLAAGLRVHNGTRVQASVALDRLEEAMQRTTDAIVDALISTATTKGN